MIIFVVLTKNNPDYLAKCVQHLNNQSCQDWTAIIFDTSDKEYIEKNKSICSGEKFDYIDYALRLGYAATNNAGIEMTRQNLACKFICLLNDDAYINENFVKDIFDYAERFPDAYAFSPLFIYANSPDKIQKMGGGYFTNQCPAGEGEIYHNTLISEADINILESPRYLDFGYGAAITYRKEVFDKIGLLDPTYMHGFDEPDMAKRMIKNDMKILYVPTIVRHVCGGSSLKKKWYNNLGPILQMNRAYLYFMLKHYPIEFVAAKEIERLKSFATKPKSLAIEIYSILWNMLYAQQARMEYHDLYDPVEPTKFEKEELAKKGMPWKKPKKGPLKLRLLDFAVKYSLSICLITFCLIIYLLGM